MLDAIVGRLIRQYVAEGTCVWKDGGLLAENACLDAAQISDLFEGLAPGVLLPFTIELISVRRGVVSVSHGFGALPREGAKYADVGVSSNWLTSTHATARESINAMPWMTGFPVSVERTGAEDSAKG